MQITTILFAAALLGAGEPDTLDVATVTAEKGFIVSRKDTLEIAGHENVTFLLMQSPGLTISDMGGPAGLKTVSLKGLGSAHTSVCIDGIRIGNMQTGVQRRQETRRRPERQFRKSEQRPCTCSPCGSTSGGPADAR